MMSMNVSEKDIQNIIQSVLQNIETVMGKDSSTQNQTIAPIKMKTITPDATGEIRAASTTHTITNGIFERMEDAIDAGYQAQIEYVKDYQVKDRERIISSIRTAILNEKETLAKMVYEETKLGKYQDKIAKHELVATGTPGTEDLATAAFSGDDGLTIVEQAPFGLIGAVTPVTNPTETVVNNSISMLAAGNAVVFNVHPSSKQSCEYVIKLINQAVQAVGGPANLVSMVKNPTLDTMKVLTESPKVKVLVGTGGPGLVKALLQSGKKAIGAGAGNPPVIVDETADLENAAKSIINGASFDNNLLCIAEKEVFVQESVANDLIFHLLNNGAYMLDQQQLQQVMSFALEENEKQVAQGCSLDNKRDYHVSKHWVGKDAKLFLEKIGVVASSDIKLLICDVEFDHPFVQLEQMMPVLPIVRVKNLDEAIDLAVQAEHGNRHTAVMHSRNVDHLTKFARAIETTIFVKNASSLAGVGFGGEGHTTMTIAGPTGEGITSARTFTRQRRCVLAEGGFRIIG
ncbi:aldehyde dehydrogenase EutE [Cytobacillus spongiae]|jgi:propionaldehyde dehydrogenase|uniref:aldehyde dehydrogenase family protein n=1 Tax=Cytobacillus spongiae TaxID=2901381 RepID=UPI001F24401B|nr:aldehyde dehydrogenase family protein [Cytobacillus spongiae]UII55517.1 aldehyde dehydrogenase EutE [Cytobacillus spongiae]